MRASYSSVARKMRKMFSIRLLEGGEYFLENGAVLGRVDELSISQYFVETPEGIQLLVFAKNLKKKSGRDIKVSDVVFLQKFDGENRVILRKKYQIALMSDSMFQANEVKPIGYAEVTEEGLLIGLPDLSVDEVVTEYEELDDGRRVYLRASREKKLKNT
ncbi:MAG: hypothetical protein J6K45_03980 [Clostridia bacterium]|nr:hypothetical protein [Clostridia bacterium]